MAKVKLNPFLEGFRGKIGDLVFCRSQDQLIVGRAPDQSRHEPTPVQLAHQECFRGAVLYGRTVFADSTTKAVYEAAAKEHGQRAFALTVSDFLHAPSIEQIDLSGYTGQVGEIIHILAKDDFLVASVDVHIKDGNGTVLEQGAAAQNSPDAPNWQYQTKTALPNGQHVAI